MTTERQRQRRAAIAKHQQGEPIFCYRYSVEFQTHQISAIAPTERGAFRVINAEYPWASTAYRGRVQVEL